MKRATVTDANARAKAKGYASSKGPGRQLEHPQPVGRAPILVAEKERLKAYHAALLTGSGYDEAADVAGIGRSTAAMWRAQGREDASKDPPIDSIYRQFLEAGALSVNNYKVTLQTRVFAGTETDARLALEVLARRWPAEWGRKDAKLVMLQGVANDSAGPNMTARSRLAVKLDQTAKRLEESNRVAVVDPVQAVRTEDPDIPAGGLGLRDLLPHVKVS